MTEQTASAGAIFEFYKDMLAVQGRWLPTGDMNRRLTKIGRTILDAQIAYTQALIGANAECLGAWTNKAEVPKPERPSVAVKRNEVLTA